MGGLQQRHDRQEEYTAAYQSLQRALPRVERAAIVGLRDRGVINDDALHAMQRGIDLEEVRLDA